MDCRSTDLDIGQGLGGLGRQQQPLKNPNEVANKGEPPPLLLGDRGALND